MSTRTRVQRDVRAALCAMVAVTGVAAGQPFPDLHDELLYIPETPSVTGGAVSAFANPAAWSTGLDVESAFWWNDRALGEGGLGNYGFSAGRQVGFATQRSVRGDRLVYDYQVGAGRGNRRSHIGLAWRWSTADGTRLGRENALLIGSINRPSPYVSYGTTFTFSTESNARSALVDVGIRPLGTPLLTVFGDFLWRRGDAFEDDGRWAAGAMIRPVQGLHLGVKFREAPGGEPAFTLNVGITLDRHSVHVLPDYDPDGNLGTTSYLWRVNPPFGGIPLGRTLQRWAMPRRYESVDLTNRAVVHQTARWWDERIAWLDLMRYLETLKKDSSAEGVVLSLKGFRASAAIAFELREALQSLKDAGKDVVVEADRLTFMSYYVASVADHLVLDPEGRILLPGVAFSRTYLAGTLDKLGVGFEEWRYQSHKSAFETYARTDMSEADREQLGRMADVVYETVRAAVTSSRGLSADAFDRLVDGSVIVTAPHALDAGLVDALGRHEAVTTWLEKERGGWIGPGVPSGAPHPDDRWGRPPAVAVVYALGPCDLDEGIKGRATGAHLRRLAKRRDLAGVVLRADSPGGDPLPADLVAEGVRQIRDAGRPVVVSQASVAASGGYWISMEGSRILTTPFTITGSIGVIGGWAWDDGIGTKTGLTADRVARGRHADLFTGLRVPVVAGSLPTRNLNDEEKALIRARFAEHYDAFVDRVASARELDRDHVARVAEGRVWMGPDAITRGLCDGIGTLGAAIDSVKALANLDADDEVRIETYPERPLFRLPRWARGLPLVGGVLSALVGGDPARALEPEPDADAWYLERVLRAPAEPLLLLSPGLSAPVLEGG